MFTKIGKLMVIFLCGYFLIKWIPINHPFRLTDFFIRLVIKPLEFFAASLAFFIGLIVSARFIRENIQQIKRWNSGNRRRNEIVLGYTGPILVFYLLFQMGWEQSLILLSLSFLYGMISVEH